MLRSGGGADHWQEDLLGAVRRMAYVEQSKRLVFGNCPEYDALAFNKHLLFRRLMFLCLQAGTKQQPSLIPA
jgi:hypothetical protein